MAFFQVALIGTNSVGDKFHAGFNMDSGVAGESSAQVVADAVAAAFVAKFDEDFSSTQLKVVTPSTVSYDTVRVYERSQTPGGAAIDVAEAHMTGQVGTYGGFAQPPEVAVCLSLLTGVPGRSNRGRMYMPAPGLVTPVANASGVLATAGQGLYAQWAAAFFAELNSFSTGLDVVVWSRKNASVRNVTRVAVGNQFDSQRRRQNNTPETYVFADVS